MSAIPLDVLLTHGLHRSVVDRMRAVFADAETAAASLAYHEENACGRRGPQPCPWRAGGPLADHQAEITEAVDAWCAVGWLEEGLLTPAAEPAHRDIKAGEHDRGQEAAE
jgi:hypothetical protein